MTPDRSPTITFALASRLLGIIFAALWSALSGAQNPPDNLFGIFPEPTAPIEQRPFAIHVRFQDIGGPLTVVQQSVAIHEPNIDIAVCIKRGSSSTGPATIQTQVHIPALGSGTYTVRLTRSYQFAPATDCVNPFALYQTPLTVVNANSAVSVIEYFSELRNHYFQTANQFEIDALDSGLIAGWSRTGQKFYAYRTGTAGSSQPLLSPVCRYYGRPEYGLDTHFFSAFLFECEIIPVYWPNQWIEESPDAFATAVPFSFDGSCPPGTLPVYRLFNGKADVNHRYTASFAIREEMIAQAWTPEGYGSIGVAMCAQPTNE